MKLLLDTHALLFWVTEPQLLTLPARNAAADPENLIYVSAATVWEIAIKTHLGKLKAQALLENIHERLREYGFEPLPVTVSHAVRAAELPDVHKDPFDRMLAAQAAEEELAIISQDRVFERYGIRRVW